VGEEEAMELGENEWRPAAKTVENVKRVK
jgi:hypothetical protein